MRPRRTLIALSLVAAVFACTARKDTPTDAQPAVVPTPAEVANPLASFARLTPGEWRQTALTGKSMYHTWHWGPGEHSIRRMTDGAGAGGQPWHELQVFYWHPGRQQVRLLGVSPFDRGVSEGTIRFAGETADAVTDLDQTRGRRQMGLRWAFDGPDKYRETLLEAAGAEGLKPLVEFDHVRSETPAPRPPADNEVPDPSRLPKALEPLLGHTWETQGDRAAGDVWHTRSAFEWVPYADAIYARVVAPTAGGEPSHLFDVYFYHHTGTGVPRCLALSNRGGVYQGDVTVLDGGLQTDLTGYEGDQVVRYVARLEFEKDGTMRHRAWSLTGTERALVFDVHHQKMDPKKK